MISSTSLSKHEVIIDVAAIVAAINGKSLNFICKWIQFIYRLQK